MARAKGQLIIIGGAEDKGDDAPEIQENNREFESFEILREILPRKGEGHRQIEIISTASEDPEGVQEVYTEAFRKLGVKDIAFIHIVNKAQASEEKYIKRVKKAGAIFFSGGDQFRLTTILGGSPLIEVIRERYKQEKDFIIAGTSAGAMAMSKVMLYEGEKNEAILKGTARIVAGLGFIDQCIIDTHFIKRGRFGRLLEAIIMDPGCIGIGLGEDTALVIKNGIKAVCRGSGMVIIIDGQKVRHTNIAYAEEGSPVCIENLVVHILAKESGYHLAERKFLPSPKELRIEKNT
jgi:cyanophycinase